MILNPYKISENFVLKKLRLNSNGSLSLSNHDGKLYNFGDKNSSLKSQIKIHNPKFYFNIIRGGSSALAESYIKNDFETSNLPSLIELTAKNINLTNEFAGVLNISTLKNIFRKLFLSNTKKKVRNIFLNTMILVTNFFQLGLIKL